MKKISKIFTLLGLIFCASIFGFNIPEVQATEIKVVPPIIATETVPSSYDLRDDIYIQVENQYQLGLCYSFASLSSVETYIALNYGEYYDFSELHFATSLYIQDGERDSISEVVSEGGNFGQFFNYSLKDKSLVLEEEMPLSDFPTNPSYYTSSYYTKLQNEYNAINNGFYSIAKVNDVATFGDIYGNKSKYSASELNSLRTSVKTHIMNYGSLTAGVYWDNQYLKNSINYKVTNDSLVADASKITSYINHLISIVGWDDNYNANGAWSNPGAYICLNSWGTSWGDGGYFYVSYDDYFIEYCIQGVTDVTLSTTHNTISSYSSQQDKTFNTIHSISIDTDYLYFAYIIDVSEYKNQSISYIDSFVKGSSSSFYIKFFDSEESALNNLTSLSVINNKVNTSKSSANYFYDKYMLLSPMQITNNYMLIAVCVNDIYRSTSITSKTSYGISLESVYYAKQLDWFETDYTWNSFLHNAGASTSENYTLPIRLHTNANYYNVSQFSNGIFTVDNTHIKNNSIGLNQTITFSISNASVDTSLIQITNLVKDGKQDFTSNFTITKISTSPSTINITMNNAVSGSFSEGQYIISIPIGSSYIYRVISVESGLVYTITYNLNGGTLTTNKPTAYSDETSSITIGNPTRDGYSFEGWYLDKDFTQAFDSSNLPYTNITLYAKWDFASPTLLSKSNNVNITYYKGLEVVIQVNATHALASTTNPLTYKWYKRSADQVDYTLIDGETSSSITLHNVADTSYYVCEVTISINDTSLTGTPCTRVLQAKAENEIYVSIKKFEYDMSNTKWDYSKALSYNAKTQKVILTGLPNGVTANYTGNEYMEIGKYTAHAELVFDDMSGNASAEAIDDLNWEIRKAKITITIKDIISKTSIPIEELSTMYECNIESEYFPDDIITQEDKLTYLNLQYSLSDTEHTYIKKISASTNSFDIYDITIIDGAYKVVINELSNNNIITTNETGFIFDCEFTATNVDTENITEDVKTLLNKNHIIPIVTYQLNYSYLEENDNYNVFVPIERDLLYKGLEVYILKNNKLEKANNISYSKTGITFENDMQEATIFIVEKDKSYTSNTELIVSICIITIFVALYITIIVNYVKRKQY